MKENWSYNSWMKYLYDTLNDKARVSVYTDFGEIGNRSEIEIQEEIAYYKDQDKKTSDRVRAS